MSGQSPELVPKSQVEISSDLEFPEVRSHQAVPCVPSS